MHPKLFWLIPLLLTAYAEACVDPLPYSMTDEESQSLMEYIKAHYPSASFPPNRSSIHSFGHRYNITVDIASQPHRQANGSNYYYEIHCRNYQEKGWECDQLYEKRSISIDSPSGFVELGDGIEPERARSIIAAIRQSILVDGFGRYRFAEFGKDTVSSGKLDPISIKRIGTRTYEVYVRTEHVCQYHIIEINEAVCDETSCSFDVIRNEVVNYV